MREKRNHFPQDRPEARSSVVIERRPAFVLDRVARWLDTPRPAQFGTDFTVRRYVEFPFAGARHAIAAISAELATVTTARRGPEAVVRARASWLAFAVPSVSPAPDEQLRLAGVLHVHRFGPPVPVEVVIEPWSSTRTELRLQVRTRRGRLRLPRRYFDAAHPVMIALRDQIEARAAA